MTRCRHVCAWKLHLVWHRKYFSISSLQRSSNVHCCVCTCDLSSCRLRENILGKDVFFIFFLLSQLKQLKSVPKGSGRKPIPGSFLPFCIFYNWKMEMRVITMLCLCSGSQAKVKYLSYNIKKGSLVQPECSLCLQPGDESCLRQPWNLFDTLQESPNKG